MLEPNGFRPCFLLRNPHVQTVLSSSRLRNRRPDPLHHSAAPVILKIGGTRLLGYWNAAPAVPAKGLVILLHGWEGSAFSTYIRCTGRRLHRNGYAVFRLNYRDHGDSHHLNEGLFYASLLEEVYGAVKQVAGKMAGAPVFIVGFSLGGNIALRIARRCAAEPIAGLRHVVCISPLLDPHQATERIDAVPYIRGYFLRKWRRSLTKKQHLFPRRYDFDGMLRVGSVRKLTEMLLARYSRYGSIREYFDEYTLREKALRDIDIPMTLLTAEDDPIIAADDFRRLELPATIRLSLQTHGGHNGFIQGMTLKSWYEPRLVSLFDSIASPGPG
jgi:predicted alpha/beta-fold hydrolase